MINPKKLIEMTKKWQKVASVGRRVSSPRTNRVMDVGNGCNKFVADKGHFVVYSTDKKRFVVPLAYLTSNIFRELFRMSEEEYGLPGNRPITLPCDSIFMEYVISFVRGCASKDQEQNLLYYLDTARPSRSSLIQELINQPVLQCF